MYLLDTNVVSELRKHATNRCDPNVLRWAASVRRNDTFISAITILEIKIGALRIARKDKAQGELLVAWVEYMLLEFKDRILAFDQHVALRAAELHVPNPAEDRDAIIAATASIHGFKIVTRNVKDFASFNIKYFNPWDYND